MYCAFISVFSNCRIDPVKDYQGNNVYPDVDDVLDNGIVQSPAPHKIKFVKRQATTVA
jgi:hypothetical protein